MTRRAFRTAPALDTSLLDFSTVILTTLSPTYTSPFKKEHLEKIKSH
jgi:hypothetical protein